MPPLLPEYLSLPFQIVVEAPPTDWWVVTAGGLFTLIGAGLGAGLGGWVAYRGTLKANRSIVKQSKLEECMALVDEIKVTHLRKLRELRRCLKAGGISSARHVIDDIHIKDMFESATKVHALTRLHAPGIERKADQLVVRMHFLSDMLTKISSHTLRENEDSIDELSKELGKLVNAMGTLCNDIEIHIFDHAKT